MVAINQQLTGTGARTGPPIGFLAKADAETLRKCLVRIRNDWPGVGIAQNPHPPEPGE